MARTYINNHWNNLFNVSIISPFNKTCKIYILLPYLYIYLFYILLQIFFCYPRFYKCFPNLFASFHHIITRFIISYNEIEIFYCSRRWPVFYVVAIVLLFFPFVLFLFYFLSPASHNHRHFYILRIFSDESIYHCSKKIINETLHKSINFSPVFWRAVNECNFWQWFYAPAKIIFYRLHFFFAFGLFGIPAAVLPSNCIIMT